MNIYEQYLQQILNLGADDLNGYDGPVNWS